MMLQTEYRPTSFDTFSGNKTIIDSLKEAVARKDFPRAYLFTGIAGTGKTTLATILKKYFECSEMNYYYYNSANTRGIDTIREIAVNSQLTPLAGAVNIYVLDEIHSTTSIALEALLLLLENPPKQTIFILCTSEPEKLKLSVKRRCFQANLKPLMNRDIKQIINRILEAEEIDDIPSIVLDEIAKSCLGSAGMAVSMLDAVIDVLEESAQLEVIHSMVGVTDSEGIEICQQLVEKNWSALQPLLQNFSGAEESLRYLILSYFTKILLAKDKRKHAHASDILGMFSESFMYNKKGGLVNACFLVTR